MMLKKVLIAVPLLTLAFAVLFIVSVNIGDSESPVAEMEVTDDTGALGENNFSNFEEDAKYQLSHTSYYDFESFVKDLHASWSSLDATDRYSKTSDGDNVQLISSVIPEINYWDTPIEMYQMKPQFKSLKETAYKLTSERIDLTPDERAALLSWFEKQLSDIYFDLRNRE